MSIISKSITYLSMKNIHYDSNGLYHLFKHTPNLQRLYIGKLGEFNDQQIQPIFSSLISISMIVESSIQSIKNFFQKIPNLCYLTLELNNIYLNGYEWENILTKYFKQIKIFHFKMIIEFSPSDDIEEQVDQLLDSFRSSYWIEKHQWYVQCDWCSLDINQNGLLYTIPYAFDRFNYKDDTRSKSTNPNILNYSSYNRVQILQHTHRKRDFSKNSISSSFRFHNIRQLKIKFPLNDNFWLFLPKLDRLISIDATLNQNIGYSQLQTLIDHSPNLYSLRFCHMNNFSMSSFNITSTSIRRLEFFQNLMFNLQYFNTNECDILAKTSLGSQCEVLMIDVENRTNILQLINTMSNLRALSIRCKNDQKYQYESEEIDNDITEWLNNRLHSKYTYLINQYLYDDYQINLWIHRTP